MSTDTKNLSMSSATGKQILSLIRNGDYAHAGEEEAIYAVLRGIEPCATRKILDVGCGLGGTADCISRNGWGQVTGIDIDCDTIAYASSRYPGLKFHRCAADEVSRTVPAEFDLVVMFNTLYCFPDQRRALQQAAAVTVAGGRLAIFDYSAPSRTPEVKQFYQSYARTHWVPIVTDEIEQTLDQTGWKLCSLEDQSSNYRRWYRELIDKIDARQDAIVSAHGDRWFEYARQRYQTLLDAIEAAIIGGVIIHAEKKCG